MTRSPETVRFSVKALADLDAIFDYTLDTWGQAQARTYTLDLIDFASRLPDSRYAWRRLRRKNEAVYAARRASHVLIFEAGAQSIRIIAIVHARSDFSH
ncbi:MAG: type II toxin-antitoxin system RelE/ParE family toxin [Oceanicaulis sp.]|nr:type II toxin-antitoxin system RelE/ParE family toxin [Oceanicaulis sp.]